MDIRENIERRLCGRDQKCYWVEQHFSSYVLIPGEWRSINFIEKNNTNTVTPFHTSWPGIENGSKCGLFKRGKVKMGQQ